jgi:hypothetical protein
VCLQLLGRVSGSGAHEVCISVSITILDLILKVDLFQQEMRHMAKCKKLYLNI